MWKSRRNEITTGSFRRWFSNLNFINSSFNSIQQIPLISSLCVKSRRKPNNEITTTNGASFRRSFSNLNFITLKDIETLLADDQPPPAAAATTRRLSVFHRVHLAAFTTNSPAIAFTLPAAAAAAVQLTKSDRQISTEAEKLGKSDRRISVPAVAKAQVAKSDRRISIPGAETRIIVYTTSLRVVRSTFEACRTVQSILREFRVSIDERDLSMDPKFLDELHDVMAVVFENNGLTEKAKKLSLPKVFIGGRYIGGVEEVRQLHESGELKKIVDSLPEITKSIKSDRRISIPGAETRIIVYTTSLRVVRSTFEACRTVQSILRGFRVSIDERDLSMDSKFLDELHDVIAVIFENNDLTEKSKKLSLPMVFIGGRYIGGVEEVRQLHESGELKKIVDSLPPVTRGVCESCGDFRFVLCDECSGSHKCYSEKSGFRCCPLCNENGLVRCPLC